MNSNNLDMQIKEARKVWSKASPEVLRTEAKKQSIDTWWSVNNAMTISGIVLLFGVFTLSLAAYLIKNGKSSESVLRIFGTILIIIVSIFLVVAGYDSNQIAPVMGLLGTIAGYLLGKGESKSKNSEDP